MSGRLRLLIAGVLTVLLLVGAVVYGVTAIANYRERLAEPSQVRTTKTIAKDTAPRVVFRNTAIGDGYGLVASVPLADPRGVRAVSATPCDRVYQTNKYSMCLRIERGVLTTFGAYLLDPRGTVLHRWALPGIPSRTRISPDSKLIAVTAFVTGASYGTVAFATETQISTVTGHDYGNLETFTLLIDGRAVTAADRNFWGVTFTSDDNVFYATAATGGQTWLVRGDLTGKTLTAVKQTAECPSVSPDGSHIAYKKNISTTSTAHWSVAVLDLATGSERLLPEKKSVDDQVEWLDVSTLLFGLPRDGQAGDSNVWSIASDGSAAPRVFIEHAWSPSVVRG